jgi:hypothetical protein
MATESIAFTVGTVTFPAGTAPCDHIVVSVVGTAAGNTTPQTQTISFAAVGSPAVFQNLINDTYSVSVQNQDAANNNLGNPVVGTFTVTTINAQISVVTAVTATQTA